MRPTILAAATFTALAGALLLPCPASAHDSGGYGPRPSHSASPSPSPSTSARPSPSPSPSWPVVIVVPSASDSSPAILPVTASPQVTRTLWTGGLLVMVGVVLVACAALVTIRLRVPVRYRRGRSVAPITAARHRK